jgi:RimJ/RimL family protein N-acetyltransferase
VSKPSDLNPRQRFDGVLDERELALARETGQPLAYCTVQQGWVPLSADEDEPVAPPLSWHAGTAPLHKRAFGTPVYPVARQIGLRVWVEDDLPHYGAMLRDADLWTYMLEAAPGRLDDDLLRGLIALSTDGDHHMVRAVISDGHPIGQVRLEFGADRTTGEISYWLGKTARGKGLGTQMVQRFLQTLDARHPDLGRVTARVHPLNQASQRLLLACGFARCDRGQLGLAPRGQDRGDWTGFLRLRR